MFVYFIFDPVKILRDFFDFWMSEFRKVPYFPQLLFKLDEPNMQDTDGEAGTRS